MKNRHIYLLAAALTAISLALFVYKVRVLDYPLRPLEQREVWNVEAAVSFDPGPAAMKATLRLPTLTPGFAVLDEKFISRGFGVSTRVMPEGREAQWAIRQASGSQTLYYRALIYQDSQRIAEDTTPPFPALPQLDEPSRIAMEGLLADVRRQSADVASFTSELLRRINQDENDPYVSVFLDRRATAAERAKLATTFLAGALIPSRVAHGISLRDRSGTVRPEVLLEVHDGVQWLYFDPATRQQRQHGRDRGRDRRVQDRAVPVFRRQERSHHRGDDAVRADDTDPEHGRGAVVEPRRLRPDPRDHQGLRRDGGRRARAVPIREGKQLGQ